MFKKEGKTAGAQPADLQPLKLVNKYTEADEIFNLMSE